MGWTLSLALELGTVSKTTYKVDLGLRGPKECQHVLYQMYPLALRMLGTVATDLRES